MSDLALAQLLRTRGIDDPRILTAIADLNRADFLPPEAGEHAHGDYPYPIGHGQTISQPFVVAFMTQALELTGKERVLEIGTGSGYQTALLSALVAEVYSIEIVPPLAQQARRVLIDRLGLKNVHLRHGDGYAGWPDAAPFDAVLLTAAPPRLPDAVVNQLRNGGRLVAPVGGEEEAQDLVRVRKDLDGALSFERLLPVRFVPMTRGATGPTA